MGDDMKQYLKEFVHSAIVHPLMMFLPSKYRKVVHDRNADWAFGKYEDSNELTSKD